MNPGGLPRVPSEYMNPTDNKSLLARLRIFAITLGVALLFVNVFLPFLTNSFDIMNSMSAYLDENGIDPTRYYYTDVEQAKEAEEYLESALNAQ